MRLSGVVVWLAAVCGVQVSADQPAFPENVRRSPGTRIVSGWEATEGQIPWQLSVRMVNPVGTVGSCGASIIHPEWGFTAAHCTANRITMILRAGAVSLWQPELIFETIEFYGHPGYNPAMQGTVQPHDISLLKFPVSLTFSDRIQPIRVQRSAEKNRNFDGVKLEASGWGRTWTNGALPDNLQWVYLVGDTNERCREAYTGFDIVVDSTICASAYNLTSQSTCSGDSGGPLVEMEEDGKYTLVGVTSFVSVDGCHVDSPAGFIRPSHYHDWITQITGIHFYPEPERITAVGLTSFSKTSSSSESTESSGDSGDIYTTEASITDADSSNESADSADSSQDSVETISTTEALSSSESSETNGSIRTAESEETVTVTEDATTESDTDATENLSSHDSDSSFTKSILLNHESVIDWRG